jgi:hypothetical protein
MRRLVIARILYEILDALGLRHHNSSLSGADIAGVMHFPTVQTISKRVLDCDLLAKIAGAAAALDAARTAYHGGARAP